MRLMNIRSCTCSQRFGIRAELLTSLQILITCLGVVGVFFSKTSSITIASASVLYTIRQVEFSFVRRIRLDDYGNMFSEKQLLTFGSSFQDIWQKVSNMDSGQIRTDDGLFTFLTVYPLIEAGALTTDSDTDINKNGISSEHRQYNWKLVLHVRQNYFIQFSGQLLNDLLKWYFGVVGIISIFSLVWAYLITIRKISDQKQKYYQQKYKKANAIVNHSHIVLFQRKNIDGWPMEYVSANVFELCGYTAEEFITHKVSYSGMIHPEDRDKIEDEFLSGINNGGISEFSYNPYRIITRDGKIKWV